MGAVVNTHAKEMTSSTTKKDRAKGKIKAATSVIKEEWPRKNADRKI